MKILVTGDGGFIGSALVGRLLKRGDIILGIDNHNDYYDQELKKARVARYSQSQNYRHKITDITNQQDVNDLVGAFKPDCIVHLAAQAGVRYSLENPRAYVDSNLIGFANVIQAAQAGSVGHFVYASSSSVYGANKNLPFSESQQVDHPLSLYAATKKSNELMAYAYSHLHALPTTGLRFFTVYGPWGRPDMALFKFTRSILLGEPIKLFNHGEHSRDFTYIDDATDCILLVIDRAQTVESNKPRKLCKGTTPWAIYNVGSGTAVPLTQYVRAIEFATGKKAIIELTPMQAGDVENTQADIKKFLTDFGTRPLTQVHHGVAEYVHWFRSYYKL
jgi:UDP-glucuronate 4-epimerase